MIFNRGHILAVRMSEQRATKRVNLVDVLNLENGYHIPHLYKCTIPNSLSFWNWYPGKDILTYNVGPAANPDCTKKQVLSDVPRIFDSLGLLAIVIQFKIGMTRFQQKWRTTG